MYSKSYLLYHYYDSEFRKKDRVFRYSVSERSSPSSSSSFDISLIRCKGMYFGTFINVDDDDDDDNAVVDIVAALELASIVIVS